MQGTACCTWSKFPSSGGVWWSSPVSGAYRCTNVEAQVISRISGSTMGDKQKVLTIAEYYLYDVGGPVEQVGCEQPPYMFGTRVG